MRRPIRPKLWTCWRTSSTAAASPGRSIRAVSDRAGRRRPGADLHAGRRRWRHAALRPGTDTPAGDRCTGDARPLSAGAQVRRGRSLRQSRLTDRCPAPALYDPACRLRSLWPDVGGSQRGARRPFMLAIAGATRALSEGLGQSPPGRRPMSIKAGHVLVWIEVAVFGLVMAIHVVPPIVAWVRTLLA